MPRTATVSLWRIAKHTAVYHASDLSGGGAKSTGGRWNSKGVAVVYAATSIALAAPMILACDFLGHAYSSRTHTCERPSKGTPI